MRLLVFLLALLVLPCVVALQAQLDKTVYVTNETLQVAGIADAMGNITFTFTNSSGIINVSTNETSNDSGTYEFSLSHPLTDYAAGSYTITVSDGSSSVYIPFQVVASRTTYIVKLTAYNMVVFSTSVINLSTGNETAFNGSFTDMIADSRTSNVYFFNLSDENTTYYGVLVDKNKPGVYDTLYFDDDLFFMLFNASEDNTLFLERQLREGDGFYVGGTLYVIGNLERSGASLLIGLPVTSATYSAEDTVYYIVLVEDEQGSLITDDLNITYVLANGSTQLTQTSTNADGYYIGSVTAGGPGSYIIDVNDGRGVEFFNVESFMLTATTKDTEGNPTASFAPNSIVTIEAVTKNSSGPITASSVTVVIHNPDGSTATAPLSDTSQGVYSTLSPPLTAVGQYGVRINATAQGISQIVEFGFSVEQYQLQLVTINTNYIDEAQSESSFVNTFGPGNTVTVMSMLSDIASGGFMSETGLIDIDNASTETDECSAVQVTSITDQTGSQLEDGTYTYEVHSLYNLSEGGSLPGDPPENMLRQCIILLNLTDVNQTGDYRIQAELAYGGDTYSSGEKFKIQRLLAQGSTVDANGADFGFFSPGETVRIKLDVTDLLDDSAVDSTAITDVAITEIVREFPSYQDVYANITNQSVVNGTLSFTAPNIEGFFRVGFNFRANISGTLYSGTGMAFFMLKKYFIIGDACGQFGCFHSPGENISLTVTIVDVDKGALFDIGFDKSSQGMSCTGCAGLIVTIENIRNEQLFLDVDPSDYGVVNGSVINSTSGATVQITDTDNLPSGFYSADIVMRNENGSQEYFGWGFFEIRNFFVQLSKAYYNETDDSFYAASYEQDFSGQGMDVSEQYALGEPLYILVKAMQPSFEGPADLTITDAELVSVLEQANQPIPKTCNESSVEERDFLQCDMGNCSVIPDSAWILTLNCNSVIDNDGQYRISVSTTTSEGEDMGSAGAIVSSYQVASTYRGSDFWDPLFSSDEVLEVNITATDFDGNPVDISNATVDFIFDKNQGRPKRITDNIWNMNNTTCVDNNCTVLITLSNFTAGRYSMEILVYDEEATEQMIEVTFQIKNTIFAIPQILEAWNWLSASASTGELTIWGSEDRCDNRQRSLNNDPAYNNMMDKYKDILQTEDVFTALYVNDTFGPGDDFSVGVPGPDVHNLTNILGLNKSLMPNVYGNLYCIHDNILSLTNDLSNCIGGPDHLVGIVTNTSHVWIKVDGAYDNTTHIYNMSGEAPFEAGALVAINSSSWDITDVYNDTGSEKQLVFRDSKAIKYTGDGSRNDMLIVSEKPGTVKVDRFCYFNGNLDYNDGVCDPGTPVYVVMNGTKAFLSTSTNLSGNWVAQGTTGATLSLGKVGYGSDGTYNGETVLMVPTESYGIFTPDNSGGDPNFFYLPEYFPTMYGRIYCVGNEDASQGPAGPFQWDDYGDCDDNRTRVFVFSNGTHLWLGVDDDNDLTDNTPIGIGGTSLDETINEYNWTIVNITNQGQQFRIRLSDNRICGQAWSCDQNGCNQSTYTLKAPQADSTFYFERINLINSNWGPEDFPAFQTQRYVYIYHNTTNLWMMNDSQNDFTAGTTAVKGGNLLDPYGGNWTVQSLLQSSIVLVGNNVAGTSGVFIDINNSKSGVIRIGRLREEELGFFKEGGRSGIDLNGNSLTNDTFYYALMDKAVAGVYDTFYFNSTSSFAQPISIDANAATRTFVANKLTLLSIDPRADRIRFYTQEVGDWSDLGDLAATGNIRIPVIVRSPSGTPVTANVNVSRASVDDGTMKSLVTFNETSNNISGIGEILFNSSTANYTFTAGQHFFEVKGVAGEDVLTLDQWAWPRVYLRQFLTTQRAGYGTRISGFKQLPVWRFPRDTAPSLEVRGENISNIGYDSLAYIAENTYTTADNGSCGFVKPSDAGDPGNVRQNSEWRGLDQYYFYFSYDAADDEKVWVKAGDCNFTGAPYYVAGNVTTLNKSDIPFYLTVIFVNATQDYAGFGVLLNETETPPIRRDSFDNMPMWSVHGINLSNVFYNALLLNSTTETSPICAQWGGQECANAMLFTDNGTYGSVLHAGDNLAISDLFVASIGPQSWSGITLGNNSQLTAGNIILGEVRSEDGTPLYVKAYNEETEQYDLDFNDTNKTYYIVAFDDLQNAKPNLTRILIDDDAEVTSDWRSQDDPPTYYDMYGEEVNMSEQWGNPPMEIWEGNLRFYQDEEGRSWDELPQWSVQTYTLTDMLIAKDQWCGIDADQSVTVILKVYHFNQSPIVDGIVNVSNVYQFGYFGARTYTNYTYDTELTDANGYALVTITPTSTWEPGEYLFRLLINATTTETVDAFIRIGQSCGGN